uniref:Uncharacterized protein n=1 Tax=Romanomermis culicivorax TaxID=13658 RepID=A0A915IUA9_ROMCU
MRPKSVSRSYVGGHETPVPLIPFQYPTADFSVDLVWKPNIDAERRELSFKFQRQGEDKVPLLKKTSKN